MWGGGGKKEVLFKGKGGEEYGYQIRVSINLMEII